MTSSWSPPWGHIFVLVILISEAALLFVAAQAGFLSGPRVLANMATDRWVPTSFSALSDRLVTQNGVILMGAAALVTLILTKGSVGVLVVLYSINVFITFSLSQAGMVRHWWQVRRERKDWWKKMFINGPGFVATTFILCAVVILKFHEGGWVTLIITGVMAIFAGIIKRHYRDTIKMLKRLNPLVESVGEIVPKGDGSPTTPDTTGKTAVILVNGFNGLGLHTMMGVTRYFGRTFKNYVFIQVGVIDAGNFKGTQEMERLKETVHKDLNRYVDFMRHNGYYSQSYYAMGTDVTLEVEELAHKIVAKYPDCVFFGGQLVFPHETFMTKLLHNHTVFTIQKRLYHQGIPFMVLPVRV